MGTAKNKTQTLLLYLTKPHQRLQLRLQFRCYSTGRTYKSRRCHKTYVLHILLLTTAEHQRHRSGELEIISCRPQHVNGKFDSDQFRCFGDFNVRLASSYCTGTYCCDSSSTRICTTTVATLLYLDQIITNWSTNPPYSTIASQRLNTLASGCLSITHRTNKIRIKSTP